MNVLCPAFMRRYCHRLQTLLYGIRIRYAEPHHVADVGSGCVGAIQTIVTKAFVACDVIQSIKNKHSLDIQHLTPSWKTAGPLIDATDLKKKLSVFFVVECLFAICGYCLCLFWSNQFLNNRWLDRSFISLY